MLKYAEKVVKHYKLDLSDLCVLTEAANGPFAITPILALLGNAKRVIALSRDSVYGTVSEVYSEIIALSNHVRTNGLIEFETNRELVDWHGVDIITNLGHVRPLDKAVLRRLQESCVISLMCEGWEIRDGDIDFEVCMQRQIAVIGTNEEAPDVNVFAYCGLLATKQLLDAHVPIHNCSIVVFSNDKFGRTIVQQLRSKNTTVQLFGNPNAEFFEAIKSADALIVAEYLSTQPVISNHGCISPKRIHELNPYLKVIQFAGVNDVDELERMELEVFPPRMLQPQRMARTLADLGYEPVVRLHAAGLKIGQELFQARRNLPAPDAIRYVAAHSSLASRIELPNYQP